MLVLYKGDDSGFAELQNCVITIKTALNLAGYTGRFYFLGNDKCFTAAEVATKTVSFNYTSEETRGFAVGQNFGTFHLYDSNGLHAAAQKVVVNVLLHRNPSTDPNNIEIEIDNVFDYNKVSNKPSINGVEIKGIRNGKDYKLNCILDYDATQKYAVGDQVVVNKSIYRCISAIVTPEIWTVGHWEVMGRTSDVDAVHYTADIGKSSAAQAQARQNIGAASQADFAAHAGNRNNPHGVTKGQVGLGNVDNTSDAAKPISNATQAALNQKVASASLKAAFVNPADVKLAPADIKRYLVDLYNAIQNI